jgi:endonuclease YncB( thermonuclease family)/thiol-disulfide isomerase/thioredoxin
MKITRIVLPLFLLVMASPASAIVLRAKVAEVRDGKSLVVVNGSRSLTVILVAVDTPDLLQEYGDVAREHLASLVLGKEVQIEFTQLQTTSVVGKVVYNNADIGLQIIRDGVAWYDKSNDQDLSGAERTVYVAAEQAARNERRGLWHDGSPMPPWVWRRAQVAQTIVPTPRGSKGAAATVRSLTMDDLLFARRTGIASAPASATSKSAPERLSAKPSAKPLNRIGEDFDFRSYLTQGRTSIVYFYADWCPTCRQVSPVMEAINAQYPDYQVLFMNIGDWNTPLTQRYGITFVPYFRIYDKTGSLVAEGNAARSWLQQTF